MAFATRVVADDAGESVGGSQLPLSPSATDIPSDLALDSNARIGGSAPGDTGSRSLGGVALRMQSFTREREDSDTDYPMPPQSTRWGCYAKVPSSANLRGSSLAERLLGDYEPTLVRVPEADGGWFTTARRCLACE